MPQISIRLKGEKVIQSFDILRLALRPVSKSVLEKYMTLAMKMTVPFQGGTSYDVPERGYMRTGRLGRSTYLQETNQGYSIRSNAYFRGREYSRYVIGDAEGEGQAGIHIGYWHTLKSSVDAYMDLMVSTLDTEIQAEIKQAGL